MRAWNVLLIFEMLSVGSEAAINCTFYPKIVAKNCCPYDTPYTDTVLDQCYVNISLSHPAIRDLEFSYCLADCYMNTTQIFADGKYNSTNCNVLVALEKVDAPEYIPFMTTVYQKCEQKVRDFLAKQKPADIAQIGSCNPFAGLIIQCLNSEYVLHCPGNNWINTTACNSLIDYFETCPLQLILLP